MAKKVKSSANKAKDVESRKIKLSVMERLMFSSILPNEGDIISLTISRDIMGKIRFDQPEMKKIELKKNGKGGFTWDIKKGKERVFSFTTAEIEIMKTEIDKLDKQKKITPDTLTLCLKIRK